MWFWVAKGATGVERRKAVRQYQNAQFIHQQSPCVMNIKTCVGYNNGATVVGIYFPLLLPRVYPSPALRGRFQLQMGQTASVKLRKFVGCSSSTTEEEQDFRPRQPTFAVTTEVPNSKPASLQPNRYSESNRSFQSLAKDSFVLDLVSPLPTPPVPPLWARPLCGSRRAAVLVDYPELIVKLFFDSVSQPHYLHHHLLRHLHHLPLPLQCKDTRSPPLTRHSSSIASTSLSKNSARVPTDASLPLNTVDLERVARSRRSPTSTPSAY